jgi:hypothetical protein
MWYRAAKKDSTFETKIVRVDAERAVRRRLFLQGNYNPATAKVASLTDEVVEHLKQKYGKLENIRNHLSGDQLTPAVEEAAAQVLKR